MNILRKEFKINITSYSPLVRRGIRILFFILFFIFLIPDLHSTDSSKSEGTALLFSLNSIGFQPSEFAGGLGLQIYLKKELALRLNFGYINSSETRTKPQNTENDWVFSTNTIEFQPGIRKDFLNQKNLIVYSGLLGLMSYSIQSETGRNYKSLNIKQKSYNYGGGLFLGAEWYAGESFSIGAEYRLIVKNGSGSTETSDGTNTQKDLSPSKSEINLSASNVVVMLAFHF